MGWLTDKLFNYRLKKALVANGTRKAVVVNNDASRVMILFDESQIDNHVELKKQIIEWRNSGKKVKTFSYADVKEFGEGENQESRLCKKDINWFSVPIGEKVNSFIAEKYDILLTINPRAKKQLLYLNAASLAKFKIGLLPDNVKHYNLLIDCKQPESIKAIFADINITLDKLTNG